MVPIPQIQLSFRKAIPLEELSEIEDDSFIHLMKKYVLGDRSVSPEPDSGPPF